MKHLSIICIALLLCNCMSLVDPNTGELDSDKLWAQGKYAQALELIEPAALRGYPWAQLRLGIAYEYGQGKPRDYAEAMNWYRKAAVQVRETAWADGMMVISAGEDGYFNQNSDARVAQFLVARLLSVGPGDIKKNAEQSWLWVNHVKANGGRSDILYCCENNSTLRKQKIEYARIEQLLTSLETELGNTKLESLKRKAINWKPH